MEQLWIRIDFRKADFDGNKELQRLIGTAYEVEEYDDVISYTDAYGHPGSIDEIEKHCVNSGIAFDRLCVAEMAAVAQYRISRPGKHPIDAFVDVDNEGMPYVWCDSILGVLTDKTLTDNEKVSRLLRLTQKADFPCPLLSENQPARESA